MKDIIEINGIKYKKLEEENKLKNGDFIEIGGILFRCYNEKENLCTTVEELNEEIVQNSAKDKINSKCLKSNRVMFNSNIIDGEYGISVIRKLLQGFEAKYLDTSKLNEVYGKDHIRLLKKEEIEQLGEELHNSINNWYWTMSYRSSDSDNWAYVFYVVGSNNPGYLYYMGVHGTGVVRPVISLKSDTKFSGEGSKNNPYKIVESN